MSSPDLPPRLLSTPDAARYLGVSRHTIHRMIHAGELPAVHYFKHRRVDVRDLDQFIERSKQ
jgi:excisionase family DNA binding protein